MNCQKTGVLLIALLCWVIGNSVAYTTAQYTMWTHGRFAPDRSPEIEEGMVNKLVAGVTMGGISSIAGAIWCLIAGTLFIWLPERLRRGRNPA